MPDLPKTVKIGFAIYDVIVDKHLEPHGERTGTYHRGHRTIMLSDSLEGDKLAYVLLHEVLHGIYSHWCLDEGTPTEERLVGSFGEGLCAVIRDNPVFTKCLIENLK